MSIFKKGDPVVKAVREERDELKNLYKQIEKDYKATNDIEELENLKEIVEGKPPIYPANALLKTLQEKLSGDIRNKILELEEFSHHKFSQKQVKKYLSEPAKSTDYLSKEEIGALEEPGTEYMSATEASEIFKEEPSTNPFTNVIRNPYYYGRYYGQMSNSQVKSIYKTKEDLLYYPLEDLMLLAKFYNIDRENTTLSDLCWLIAINNLDKSL